MARRGYSDAQWRAWIAEQEASGLSIARFCDRIGISYTAFYRRRNQLQSVDTVVDPFVRVSVSASPLEIELPSGAVIRLPNDDRTLERILQVLVQPSSAAEGDDA